MVSRLRGEKKDKEALCWYSALVRKKRNRGQKLEKGRKEREERERKKKKVRSLLKGKKKEEDFGFGTQNNCRGEKEGWSDDKEGGKAPFQGRKGKGNLPIL